MTDREQQVVPIWAEAKARKKIDVLKEAARTLAEMERVRAHQPIARMTECDLEAEQLRLEELLEAGTLNVEEFRRLREIDFYLQGMRERRESRWAQEEWYPDSLSD